jgi:hypothetical protein
MRFQAQTDERIQRLAANLNKRTGNYCGGAGNFSAGTGNFCWPKSKSFPDELFGTHRKPTLRRPERSDLLDLFADFFNKIDPHQIPTPLRQTDNSCIECSAPAQACWLTSAIYTLVAKCTAHAAAHITPGIATAAQTRALSTVLTNLI